MEKLKIYSIEEHVYKVLKDMIIRLELKPGERLNLKLLSQKLGISITPLRASLQRLSRENFVRIIPRGGFFVSTIDEKQVIDLFEIRRALELLALEHSINNIDKRKISELFTSFREVLKNPEKAKKSPRYDLDYKLHSLIINNYPNEYLHSVFDPILSLIMRCRYVIRTYLPPEESDWIIEEAKQHLAIAESMFEKDLEHARKKLNSHIIRSRDMICHLLKSLYINQDSGAVEG